MVQHLAIAKTTPQKACFAIAGPVVNNTAKLTNLTWFLDEGLEQELEIASISLINGFAAVGTVFWYSQQIYTPYNMESISRRSPLL